MHIGDNSQYIVKAYDVFTNQDSEMLYYNVDVKTKDLEKYARTMLDNNRDWSDIYLAMQNEVNELAKHMQSDPTLVMFNILDKAKRD